MNFEKWTLKNELQPLNSVHIQQQIRVKALEQYVYFWKGTHRLIQSVF